MEQSNRKVAIMQPYVFPYIGYFQLIQASDVFVFYDDVNFIKKGWINRNQILLNGEVFKFTIPLVGASQNKLINEIDIFWESKFDQKLLVQITQAYKNAPYFNDVYPIVESVFSNKEANISNLAIKSIEVVCDYLGLKKQFLKSSELGISKELGRAERLITITKQLGSSHYINALNGQELYDKKEFLEHGVQLNFTSPILKTYAQGGKNMFIPYLSVLDLIMWNQPIEALKHVSTFELV